MNKFILLFLLLLSIQLCAQNNKPDSVYVIVETPPKFPGGEDAMMQFIGKEIVYPAKAKENGISGRVVVSFIINIDGSISDIRTLKSLGWGCDEAVVEVIKAMPKWTPGTQKGVPVRVQFNLPVVFQLGSGNESRKVAYRKGEKALQIRIQSLLQYPDKALKNGVEGAVEVLASINSSGKITGSKIVKGLSKDCDKEARRIVNQLDDFVPAQKNGRAVKSKLLIIVVFKLPGSVLTP